MLSLKQLQDVCLLPDYSYRRCRYLSQDENDHSKFYCVKLTSRKQLIDEELDDFVKDHLRKNLDPKKANVSLGDNCKGYPLLRHIEQGYDQDN